MYVLLKNQDVGLLKSLKSIFSQKRKKGSHVLSSYSQALTQSDKLPFLSKLLKSLLTFSPQGLVDHGFMVNHRKQSM